MRKLTHKQATESARDFVRHCTKPGHQWTIGIMDRYLPDGWEIRIGADFCDRVTIATVAAFIRAEACPTPEWARNQNRET